MAKAKKTSSRISLTPDQLQSLKDAITAGESPKSIHERLGVSIANIHYHKTEMKKKGLLTGTQTKKVALKEVNSSIPEKIKKVRGAYKKTQGTSNNVTARKEAFKLIVNGVSVQIDGASSVAVGEGYVKVDF